MGKYKTQNYKNMDKTRKKETKRKGAKQRGEGPEEGPLTKPRKSQPPHCGRYHKSEPQRCSPRESGQGAGPNKGDHTRQK